MTLTDHPLRGSVLRVGAGRAGNRLTMGLPWYRSMPMSAILDIGLDVDDEPVAVVGLDTGDGPADLADLRARRDQYWFLQDRPVLVWTGSSPTGPVAKVRLSVRMHLPNLVGPDGRSLQVVQEVIGAVPVEDDP